MCTTIKELIIAHKLFDKKVTYDDLLSLEFNEPYLLTQFSSNIEQIPIWISEEKKGFLRYLDPYTCAQYKYIKPNLYATRTFINFLESVKNSGTRL